MRVFANLFLILFLADGGFSLIDELVSILTPLMPFPAFRNFLAVVVIIMAVPVYLSLGIDQRIPKRIFLPPIFLILWSLISTWLFPVLADIRIYGLLMAAIQVALGMLPFYLFRKRNERCLTMPATMFFGSFFSLRNSLIFCGVNIFVIPLVLVLFFFTVANAYMTEHTSGFMRLVPVGLQMTERVYKRDNRTIRLAAMIHVGDKEYYKNLAESVSPGRTIVLAEGVTDDDHQIRNGIDYGRVAGFLGLSSQDKMLFRGRLIKTEDLDSDRLHPDGAGREKQDDPTDILRADVDISDFRPPTILFLDSLGKHLRESPSFIKGLLSLNRWAEQNISPEMYTIIMDDILHRRNMVVIGYLDRALKRYDTIVIPWGALHMKELEVEVLKRGFTLQEERGRVSIDFRKMLQGKS